MEYKTLSFEVKDQDESTGEFEGLAAHFKNIDLGGDIIEQGAFAKNIRESKGKWAILADHNPSEHIGFNLEAEETDKGLKVKGKLDIENVQKAREKYSLAKMAKEIGAKMGLSIGYRAMKDEYDTNTGIRTLKELKVFEYSFVTFPMNPKATVSNIKSLDLLTLKDQIELLLLTYDFKTVSEALERAAQKSDPDLGIQSDLIDGFEAQIKLLKQMRS